jgi:hypothetical protein
MQKTTVKKVTIQAIMGTYIPVWILFNLFSYHFILSEFCFKV